jgi:Skp family chaperone for outer membrane proteins
MKHLFLSSVLVVMVGGAVSAQRPAPTATPVPAAPVSANVNIPVSKMAVIYSDMFLDPKGGILKFSALITKLNNEFQKQKDEITQMQQRGGALEAEINKLQTAPSGTPIDQKSLQAKIDQLEQLKRDAQRKAEDAQASYNRRREELFQPLQKEIGLALEVYAKARGITLIIDGAQVPMVYAADSTDITRAFIVEFNSKNPVTASTTPPQ